MVQRDRRWPIWKIVTLMLASAAASAALFCASHVVSPVETAHASPNSDTQPAPARLPKENQAAANMSNVLLLFGCAMTGVTLVCAGWLVYRYRSSAPAWKRQTKYTRRR